MRRLKIKTALVAMSALCLIGGTVGMQISAKADADTAFEMISGLSIRTTTPEGLRFAAKVTDKSATATYGMVMLPDGEGTEDLSITIVEGNITASNSNAALVIANNWYTDEQEEEVFGSAYQDTDVYTGVLVDSDGEFPESLYNTPIVAQGFKVEGSTVTYTTNTVSRSIGYVATVAEQNGINSAVITKIAGKTDIALDIGADEVIDFNEEITPVLTIGGVEIEDVTYATTDEALATVTAGVVKGVATTNSTVTIDATATVNGVDIEKSFTFSVKAKSTVVYAANTPGLDSTGPTSNWWGTIKLYEGDGSNWGTASLDTEKTYGENSSSVKVAFTGNLNTRTLTLYFKAVHEKSVYQALANEGYNYISFYFQYENVNNKNSAQFYVFANGYNDSSIQVYHLTYDNLDTNRNSMRASSSAIFWGSDNEGSYNSQGVSGQIGTQGIHSSTNWCEIRVPINQWLTDFDKNGEGVCSIGFKAGNTNMPTDTVVWFGGCEVVKIG